MQPLRILVTLIALVLLGGCAMFKNTPRQEKTLADFNACRDQLNLREVRLTHVTPDGRFAWSGGDDRNAMMACMREKGYRFPTEGG